MRVCSTPGCPTLIPAGSYKGRCPQCNRDADKARGTRAERQYGRSHVNEHNRLARLIRNGERVTCWRCGEPITNAADLHLGHDDDDRTVTRGPEHSHCNLSAAGKASHRTD